MTLKEIAKEVGVSVSTVSRVLNKGDYKAAGEKTCQKIYEAARRLDYKPNAAARELQHGSNRITSPRFLNCIIARPPAEAIDDPFYSTLIKSMTEEALKHNYIINQILYAADQKKISSGSGLAAGSFEGTIVLGRFNRAFARYLKKAF